MCFNWLNIKAIIPVLLWFTVTMKLYGLNPLHVCFLKTSKFLPTSCSFFFLLDDVFL